MRYAAFPEDDFPEPDEEFDRIHGVQEYMAEVGVPVDYWTASRVVDDLDRTEGERNPCWFSGWKPEKLVDEVTLVLCTYKKFVFPEEQA